MPGWSREPAARGGKMAPLLYKLFFDNLERRKTMTNAAAIGYMIRAAKQAGLDHDTIKVLEALK
ncbi:MAG: hypothetical protein GX425_14665 [Peptococcaceae bacterium]|nr:hypothetical protein [Peptococcaceae bacterium]